MKTWYEKTLRWCQTNLTENDLQRGDVAFWQQKWLEWNIQGVIINCGGIVSYHTLEIPHLYRPAQLGDTDLYALYHDAAREMGLSVVARMDIHSVHEDFFREHPEWFCQDEDGTPVTSQGRYVACVNGDYCRKHVPEVLRAIIERYQPDGFADNSWAGLGRDRICHCARCQSLFFEDTGRQLPKTPSWDDSDYPEWIRWNYRARVKNWDLFNETTQRVGGEACRWFGMVHANPFHSGERFVDLKKLLGRMPMVFCDHQSRDARNGFEQNTVNGALLHGASGWQVPLTQSMAHYYRGIRTYRLNAATRGETRLWMLAGFAGGILPWPHFVSANQEDRRRFTLTPDLMAWHQQQEAFLIDRSPMANVGIVWSQENIDFYGRDGGELRCEAPWRGFVRALSRRGIPIRPVHADDILAEAATMDVLILPDVAVLTPLQQESLVRWLDLGKHLVMSQRSGLMAEDGKTMQAGPLWEALELSSEGRFIGEEDNGEGDWATHETHSGIRLPKGVRHPVLDGFEMTDLLPFGGRVLEVISEGALQPICSHVPSFPIYPPEFSWIREEREDVTPIYAGTLPSGSRVVYLAGDVDRCHGRYLTPDLADLLSGCVTWAAGETLPCRVEAPGHVHCVPYRQAGRMLVHLLNLAGADGPLGTCEGALPVGPVVVHLRTDLCAGKTARLDTGEVVPLVVDVDGRGSVHLDCLEEHRLLILEDSSEFYE